MVFLCGRVGKSTRLFRGPSFPLHPTPEVYPDLHISFPPTNHQPSLVPSHKTHNSLWLSTTIASRGRVPAEGTLDIRIPHTTIFLLHQPISLLISDRPLPVFAIIILFRVSIWISSYASIRNIILFSFVHQASEHLLWAFSGTQKSLGFVFFYCRGHFYTELRSTRHHQRLASSSSASSITWSFFLLP